VHDQYYGVETVSPRLLVAVEARLGRVLDLTSARVRRRLALAVHVWADEDWRQMQDDGRESLSQAIGRAVWQAGGSGLLAPSSAVRGGVNVVVFPRRLGFGESVAVVEGEKLERWKTI
jgi:RES domain-containing protein